ncbi:MAG: glycosyltransferase [Bacteroidetes bacterium]|nr:glycosyltransferase [Bacteroidota bacterium]
MKKKIFLLYPFYWPFYKAGGPVQSLVNLSETLADMFQFSVLSKDHDIDGSTSRVAIEKEKWQKGNHSEMIFYLHRISFFSVKRLLEQTKPDVVMVNGIFNISTTIPGIVMSRWMKYKVVMSPRGMLQQGALAVHPSKKKVFLLFFKLLNFQKGLIWHATDEQEKIDIERAFGFNSIVKIAPNIPKRPWKKFDKQKSKGPLRIVYLSLITQKKKIDVALRALSLVDSPVVFHIYGPIKDQSYWNECTPLLISDKHDIKYNGPVDPEEVQQKLSTYDVMILPTQGENFGHSIYESLSVGTPVLLSPYTPWGKLQDHYAGVTVNSFEPQDWANGIQQVINLEETQYQILSSGALTLATSYFEKGDFVNKYLELFSVEP